MKRLTKVFLLVILPFCVCAQSNTFRSNLDKRFINVIYDTIIRNADTTQYLSIKPRLLGVNSVSNKNEVYSTYLLGLSLEANIKNKFKLIAYYNYLDGNYDSEIKNYQDSLTECIPILH